MGIFFCVPQFISAQTAKQYIAYGDEAMKKGEYYNAAEYFKMGLEKFEFNLELEYKYAEALRGFNDYKNASEAYKKVVQDDVTHTYPLATFWYGMMQHYLGRYESAIAQYKKFKLKYTEKGYYKDKAQQEIESCSWALANVNDTATQHIIHLPPGVNSDYSETNPFQDRDGHLLYSSLRDQSSNKKKPKFLARIYQSDSAYKSSKLFTIPADQSQHIANGAFSPDMKRFYFTLCENDENKSLLRCDIYVSKVKHDSLSEPQKLSNVNASGYTSTQPNVGIDEKGDETLYFVSDRAGGTGKTDIWMSKINKDGSYQDPINLGKEINTEDEEFSPFYDSHEHKLYFASNWHYSFGGLDIFYTTWQDGAWAFPKNLGHAVNSSQNDFYFFKSADRSKNYFASNRKGSNYIKSETCCNDIWMYETGMKIEVPKQIDTPESKITAEVKVDSLSSDSSNKNITAEMQIDTAGPPLKGTLPPSSIHTLQLDTPQRVWIDKSITKIKQLLPVTLYFHNDEPECCNLRDTTGLNYVSTYQAYIGLLDKYKHEFDKGLAEDEKSIADQEVFDLFTSKVEKGYYNLIRFSAQLLDILQSGQKMEITIQGYCSPLNYSEYNIKLGYRRIASLRNYFYHYRGGILMPFIDSGKLVLKNESLGKERAAKNVSDSHEDLRNSVYNPAAAQERKVEIISVEIK
jgi:outer membrane protein OmpA-like peptidoglycan-associated protein